MRVMVTGGSGFIGSHVVDKLREHGVTVRIFDAVYPTWRQDIEFYQGSILDVEALRMALNRVDAVIHLAAVADVKDVFQEPHYAEAINVRGTVNVLEAVRRTGARRVVFGSTTWVYSDVEAAHVDESTPLTAPNHLYTATKIAGEYYCQAYNRLYDIETTILRFGIPYGPRARPAAVIPTFVGKVLRGEPLTIQGDGSQYRKFVYVEDLAEGNVLALKPAARNKIYNLDGHERISIREVAETIKKIVGAAKIQYSAARPADFGGKEVSSQKARDELGWESRTSFEEGLRKYIDWYTKDQAAQRQRWELVDDYLKV
jgi:UDP-glucose 4-epimerase